MNYEIGSKRLKISKQLVHLCEINQLEIFIQFDQFQVFPYLFSRKLVSCMKVV